MPEKSICDPYRPKLSRLIPVLPKMPEKVEIITRTPAELRPSDFSLRFFLPKSTLNWPNFDKLLKQKM